MVTLSAGCTTLKRITYEGFNRDGWQRPAEVIDSLGMRPGDHVADLGSGSGYFTLSLARAVGQSGKVYAVDVDAGINEYLAKRLREEGLENVEIILAEYHDPLLPESGVDLIFICNTYHHIEDRIVYFADVRRYLRPGGRIAIIDFDRKGLLGWFLKILGHWPANEMIRKEMEAAGYHFQREFDFLPFQNFLIFSIEKIPPG